MATHVPQRDLRNNSGEVLARVERGEELTITVRGRPVADLVPTRERAGSIRPTHEQFVAGLRGLLAPDDRLDDCEILDVDEVWRPTTAKSQRMPAGGSDGTFDSATD